MTESGRPRKAIIAAVVIVLAVLAIVGAVLMLARHVTHAMTALEEVNQDSRVVDLVIHRALDQLQQAASAQRAFMLTGGQRFLLPFEEHTEKSLQSLGQLTPLARDRPWLRGDAEDLQQAVREALEAMRPGMVVTQTQGPQARLAAVNDLFAEASLQRARAAVARITSHADAVMDQRSQALRRGVVISAVAVLAGAFLAAGLLGAAALALLLSRTRLLRLQTTARLQSQRLQTTIDQTRDGVAVFDAEDRLLLWNKHFFPATGFAEALAAAGTPFAAFAAASALWAPAFLSGPRPAIGSGGEDSAAVAGVIEARHDGKVLEVWRSAMPDGGQMVAIADITRRVAAEAIAGQAQKMEALGQLTGGVAHDFNNLLQVISANLELIGGRVPEDVGLRAWLSAALAGVDRAARLTRHLLAFARRQSLAPRAVDTTQLLTEFEEMLRRTLGGEIEIELVLSAPALWAIRVDPQQLENALLNLAINGRDAMQGGGRLVIEARNAVLDEAYAAAHGDVSPGQYVMIAVTDTGHGMTEAQLARAIEPFYTTKPEGRGTGLGLSMVYGFVRQSGGHMQLASVPDQGTTARLYIPRTTSLPQPVPQLPAQAARGEGETILLVEDDPAVRLAAAQALRGLGYGVREAENADTALALLHQGPAPDLLFTDVMMPGNVSARQLAVLARQLHPGIAVLFTSGYTELAGGRLEPGVMLVTKPWKIEDVAYRLRAALAAARAPGVAVAPHLRILLAEDDPLVRMTTADILADMGHEVVQAGSGGQALALLDSVDVLICDLGLPDMDGSALVGLARRRRPDLRVIIASGRDRGGSGEIWLEKPYDAAALRASLRAVSLTTA